MNYRENLITLSVVIATYNAERTLIACLNSIVPQLTNECELIIIDGGSKDGTCEIIKSYNEQISYTISGPDKGIYDAWNKGIKAANGKWISFIGADDVLLPGAIEAYLNAIKNTPDIDSYDYICAHNEHVDAKGKLLKVMGEEPKWSIMRERMAPAHVASLHNKKNLFDTIGYYDYEHFYICADYELLMRKRNHLKYLMLPDRIARMKVGGMSFSTKAIKETYNIRKKHHSISAPMNAFLYMRDVIAFKLFIMRNRLRGANFER